MVVACNTSSAVALASLEKAFPLPVLGVIKPGAVAALRTSVSKSIGVIGTYRTVASHSYRQEIKALNRQAKVFEKNCSLFVPIIEDGFNNKKIIELVIKDYIEPFSQSIDTLVLGCTHYPLIKHFIQKAFPELTLVDSALETSKQVQLVLKAKGQLKQSPGQGRIEIVTNDLNEVFVRISRKLFPQQQVGFVHSW